MTDDHSAPAAAKNVWHVENRLLGRNGKRSKNMSGIACRQSTGFPRECLVIDDELQSAQFVTLKDGEIVAGDMVALIDNSFEGDDLPLDGEGVAYADGFFYVIGSHGHPRDPDRSLDPIKDAATIAACITASSQIVRIARDGQVKVSAKLRDALRCVPDLEPFVDRRLDENGVTIEGVAVLGDRLFAGFRSPSLNDDQAAILSVPLVAIFGEAAADPKLSLVTLGKGRGVRDLAPYRDGLLVLAGPAPRRRGDFSVFWWDAGAGATKLLADLPAFEEDGEQTKPEAILPLEESAEGLRVLILFDGAKEGAPRDFVVRRP